MIMPVFIAVLLIAGFRLEPLWVWLVLLILAIVLDADLRRGRR